MAARTAFGASPDGTRPAWSEGQDQLLQRLLRNPYTEDAGLQIWSQRMTGGWAGPQSHASPPSAVPPATPRRPSKPEARWVRRLLGPPDPDTGAQVSSRPANGSGSYNFTDPIAGYGNLGGAAFTASAPASTSPTAPNKGRRAPAANAQQSRRLLSRLTGMSRSALRGRSSAGWTRSGSPRRRSDDRAMTLGTLRDQTTDRS